MITSMMMTKSSSSRRHHPNTDKPTSGRSLGTDKTGVLSSSDSDEAEQDFHLPQDVALRLEGRVSNTVAQSLAKFPFVRDKNTLAMLPRFTQDQISIHELVAKGGFSNVHSVTFHDGLEQLLEGNQGRHSAYVLKHLNPRLTLNTRKLVSGAKDLVLEAHMLSALDHEHILPLRGWSAAGIASFVSTGRVDSFFLVFDRLEATLFQRMGEWRRMVRQDESGTLNDLHKRKKIPETMQLYQQRLSIAHDISKAFAYLHENNIFHMDLKPGNVGFDSQGTVKLFDFGLAVEVQPWSAVNRDEQDNPHNRTYDLKGKKGTSRYMAPEVIRREHYNAKADVFSFSVLLWEMLALQKPYEELDGNQVKEYVSRMALRPKIPKNWPQQIRLLIKYSWAKRAEDRPTMEKIRDFLAKVQIKSKPNSASAQIARKPDPPTTSVNYNSSPVKARVVSPTASPTASPPSPDAPGLTSKLASAGVNSVKFMKLRAMYSR